MKKIVVKNVPPHRGGNEGEDLICSLTEDKAQRLKEVAHINDVGEEGPCSRPKDKKGFYFQHRIFALPKGTKTLPPYLYMWVDERENYNEPRKVERDESDCRYPAYYYSKKPLMSLK